MTRPDDSRAPEIGSELAGDLAEGLADADAGNVVPAEVIREDLDQRAAGLGWFADVDPDVTSGEHVWQPCLQLEGMCLPIEVWFSTEAECLEFIRENVIGQGEIAGPASGAPRG